MLKKVLTNKWFLIGLSLVIAYVVYQKYGKKSNDSTTSTADNSGNNENLPESAVVPDAPVPNETLGADDSFSRHADNL